MDNKKKAIYNQATPGQVVPVLPKGWKADTKKEDMVFTHHDNMLDMDYKIVLQGYVDAYNTFYDNFKSQKPDITYYVLKDRKVIDKGRLKLNKDKNAVKQLFTKKFKKWFGFPFTNDIPEVKHKVQMSIPRKTWEKIKLELMKGADRKFIEQKYHYEDRLIDAIFKFWDGDRNERDRDFRYASIESKIAKELRLIGSLLEK